MKKITCFSTHEFEQKNLTLIAQKLGLTIQFIKYKLDKHTASFAKESDAILCWANDDLSKETLEVLYHNGLKYISLRTAGFSNLDIKTAQDLKLKVSRVPSYSPQSIAEHTAALLLSLNRKIIKASNRVKDFNFSLEGLEGMQIFGKTVGIIGAGQIGKAFANIMLGFGCKVLIYDQKIDPELEKMQNITYTNLLDIFKNVDILSLHCPLNEQTKYIINKDSLNRMKKNIFIINTGRGGLINTKDLIAHMKSNKKCSVALDVYEFEEDIFFHDFSQIGIEDDDLIRLLSFPNVLVTSHQAFFTNEALKNMAHTSLQNIACYLDGKSPNSSNIIV